MKILPKKENPFGSFNSEKETEKESKEFQEEIYFNRIKTKLDKNFDKKIEEIFSQNESIEAIDNIVTQISTIKGDNMEKLINILVKINYSNFGKWKKILEEYSMHLSIYSDATHLYYTAKELAQIMTQLKIFEENLLNEKDVNYGIDKNPNDEVNKDEILVMIKDVFEKSTQCFMKDLETKDVELYSINTVMVTLIKYKCMNEKKSKKFENALIPIIDKLNDFDIANLLFNSYKNKKNTELFVSKIETKIENLLSDYLNEKPLDTFIITLIAKGMYLLFSFNFIFLIFLFKSYKLF
jgi:hypothetical protein